MKQKTSIFAIALLLIAGIVNSQDSTFNLKSYKLPDMKRHSLDFDVNLNTFSSNENISNELNNTNDDENIKKNNLNTSFSAYYNYFLNNQKFQKETNIRFSTNYEFLKTEEETESDDPNRLNNSIAKINSLAPNIRINTLIRAYTDGNAFFELGVEGSFYYSGYKYNNEVNYKSGYYEHSYTNEEKVNRSNLLLFIPLKMGSGRIEQVQDARQAIYIIEALKKQNRIKNLDSKKEIIEFATLISKLKNKRFFDARIRKTQEIETIDSLLQSNNYITSTDARYFTTLLDMWNFGSHNIREKGNRFSIAIYPGYYHYSSKITESEYGAEAIDAEDLLESNFMIKGGLEFAHRNPLNLYWQNNIDFFGHYGSLIGKTEDKLHDYEQKQAQPYMNLGISDQISYYPNTRTSLHAGLEVNYIQFFEVDNEERSSFKTKAMVSNINFGLEYYFSPQLTLNIDAYLLYNWQDKDEYIRLNLNNLMSSDLYNIDPLIQNVTFYDNKFAAHLNISLNYSLF